MPSQTPSDWQTILQFNTAHPSGQWFVPIVFGLLSALWPATTEKVWMLAKSPYVFDSDAGYATRTQVLFQGFHNVDRHDGRDTFDVHAVLS
jgi:hypothetical protein